MEDGTSNQITSFSFLFTLFYAWIIMETLTRLYRYCMNQARTEELAEEEQPSQNHKSLEVEEEDIPDTKLDANPEPLGAFVCDGTCGAVVDRQLTCGSPQCSFFQREMRLHPHLKFVCSECKLESSKPFRCCITRPARIFAVAFETEPKERPVWIASQFPAHVQAFDCGPHIPKISTQTTPADLVVQPPGHSFWERRRVSFWNIQLKTKNDTGIKLNKDKSHIIVAPGTEIALGFFFECQWRPQPTDYCPGCIIQWYVGMRGHPNEGEKNVFCLNVIEGFQSGLRGRVNPDNYFTAPRFPGIYYITTTISLQYSFVPVGIFENSPINSLAVIQVAYFDKWTKFNHLLLDKETRLAIETFFLLGGTNQHRHLTSNVEDCPCRLGGLESPLLSKIFSFLGPFRD